MDRLKVLEGKDALAYEKVERIEHFAAPGNMDGARVSYILNIKLPADSGDPKQAALLNRSISRVFSSTSDLRDGEFDWKAYLLDDRKGVFASVRIDVPAGFAKKNEPRIVASLCEYCKAFEKQLSAVVGGALLESLRR